MSTSIRVRGTLLSLALVVSAAGAAIASEAAHTGPVSQNAADYTPQLVATTAVSHPRVDAITSDDTTTYAGGLFNKITQGGQTYDRANLVAFDTSTGVVDTGFAPKVDKQIRAVENVPNNGGVYVGGDFTTVNGSSRAGLVKLTPAGVIDPTFKPPFSRGLVFDVELVNGHLIVAGNFTQKLISLNPVTGASDGFINKTIAGRVCVVTDGREYCSWGSTSVYDFAVTPAGDRLVAVGNFTTVDGAARSKFFMLKLGTPGAKLDPWYYPGFAKRCATEHPRRIAYLQGVDFNPTGTAFNVAATGQITDSNDDIWYQRLGDNNKPNTTVCDAIGRFSDFGVTAGIKPEWINYTGGDSMWTVADTGAAVYVQGHFKWVDNPDGYASLGIGDKTSGAPAARRAGIAAINPDTGLALPWKPAVPTRMGGKALEATPAGLWVGSDSKKFGAEDHYGIAFAPAPK
ncbi:MAG: delta-60 repeat domain-containing protein [Nocardioidaceae bacterium]|nr:delta-60 repeat domain-containing protein [Nocardioidaceae bacterium]